MAKALLIVEDGRIKEIPFSDESGIYIPGGADSARETEPTVTGKHILRRGEAGELQLADSLKGWRPVSMWQSDPYDVSGQSTIDIPLPINCTYVKIACRGLSHNSGSNQFVTITIRDAGNNAATWTGTIFQFTNGAAPTSAATTAGLRTQTFGAAAFLDIDAEFSGHYLEDIVGTLVAGNRGTVMHLCMSSTSLGNSIMGYVRVTISAGAFDAGRIYLKAWG